LSCATKLKTKKYHTNLEQFQNPVEKSLKQAKSIPLCRTIHLSNLIHWRWKNRSIENQKIPHLWNNRSFFRHFNERWVG